VPRNPTQYRGLSRRAQIARWLRHGGDLIFGNLVLKDINGDRTLLTGATYGTMFAVVEPIDRVAHVLMDLPYRSCTSTGHRNRMLEALESENYNITEILHQTDLADIFAAIKFRAVDDHLATIEEIDEDQLPAPAPMITPAMAMMPDPPPSAPTVQAPNEVSLERSSNPWYEPGGDRFYVGIDRVTSNQPVWRFHIPDSSGTVSPADITLMLQRITEISDEIAFRARRADIANEEDE